MSVAALPTGLLVPFLADRLGARGASGSRSRRGAMLRGHARDRDGPGGGWVWAALAGFGIGATFPLSLTLPLDVAREPAEAGAVVGLMLGAGYTITAIGPLGLGAIRDLTGSYSASRGCSWPWRLAFVASVAPALARAAAAPAARAGGGAR